MEWQKQGLIFSPDGDGWMKTHAQVPTPLVQEGIIRVYFSSRPERTLSLTTFVDIDAQNPKNILRVNPHPILELGKPGTFDEHGIMPSCAVLSENTVYLYYSGWSRSGSVPYNNSTGLAISEDGGETFKKVSEGPVLGKSFYDPYSATSPFVLKDGGLWHMWYCSGTGWVKIDGKYEHIYDIKYARSNDGISWTPEADAAIQQGADLEAITRPYILKRSDGYHMWFCYRGSRSFRNGPDAYRIGYAYSEDLIHWRRDDAHAGISPSVSGWDAQMIAYPSVVEVDNQVFMFYNGNNFGTDGFGYAVYQEE